MAEKPIKWTKLKVSEAGKSQDVYVPMTGDRQEEHDLIEFAVQKTKSDLAKKPEREKSKYTPDQIGGALNEYNKWKKKYKDSGTRKYY